MSIASEITRLQSAKSDLKTAIEGKGVTVSSSALLDDYPDLVDAIQTGGGGITKETVNYTVASSSYNHDIPITGDVTKILWAHFYDPDAIYTTTNTTYEGFRPGPLGTYISAIDNDKFWLNWRTNAAGSNTGWSNYQSSSPFETSGYVKINANPQLTVGHQIVVEIFYGS